MLRVTRDLILPTAITGSYPRPLWYDANLSGRSFKAALGDQFDLTDTPLTGEHVDEFCRDVLPKQPQHTIGLFDEGADLNDYVLEDAA